MPSAEWWVNRDTTPGEYAIDVQLQGFDPKRHSVEAALKRIVTQAKHALRYVEKLAADDESPDLTSRD